MLWTALLDGAIVGLSLGLTGGGGAIFAVPLLVYGLHVDPREAVAISLAAVGATSFVGFLHRWTLGEVEIAPGLLFAIAGIFGAPAGTWIGGRLPEPALLLAFAALMVFVSARLWRQASKSARPQPSCPSSENEDGPTCRRDASGSLIITSRCAALLILVGVMTGVLSGMFGVGGGFVIVPALVLFSGMSIHRAVGASLMVIALISVSGIASNYLAGRTISGEITALFIVGGIAGQFIGQRLGRRLSGPLLQKLFAVAILAVAVFVILKNLNPPSSVRELSACPIPFTIKS